MTRNVKIAWVPPSPTPGQLAWVIWPGLPLPIFCNQHLQLIHDLSISAANGFYLLTRTHFRPPFGSQSLAKLLWKLNHETSNKQINWECHLMDLLSRFAACDPLTWYLWLHVLSRSITRVQRATCTQDLGIWIQGKTISRLNLGNVLSLPRDVNGQDIGLCGRGDGQLHRAQQLQGAAELVRGQKVVTAKTGCSGLRLD